MTTEDKNRLLNTGEAGKQLGNIDATAVRRLIRKGLLPERKIDGRFYFYPEEVEVCIANLKLYGEAVTKENKKPDQEPLSIRESGILPDWGFLALLFAAIHALIESLLQGSLAIAQEISSSHAIGLEIIYFLLAVGLLSWARQVWLKHQEEGGEE